MHAKLKMKDFAIIRTISRRLGKPGCAALPWPHGQLPGTPQLSITRAAEMAERKRSEQGATGQNLTCTVTKMADAVHGQDRQGEASHA